ncbi:hypothetical protein F0562_012310 [Nyssa sinensis]|uniref:Retrovirus-related Pol polyprotein from transposon TNT 1-94-like beta-barrel domain-containing protein n=1 Tax=Nyssa sinensis TaxID=561372 RepID=A0A5J4ZX66_9ASTE|nr:hypothetical protein F0562_012310 [Nyssa sinensis]
MASQASPTIQPSSSVIATSASTSHPQPPIYLLSNICNLITMRLDSTNYVSWKFQFTSILKAHSLIEFVDGSLDCPEMFLRNERGELTAEMNPNHKSWIAQDQALMTLINATLSPIALAHIIGLNFAREVWLTLKRRFSSLLKANILQLKTELQSISKGNSSIDSYIQKIKEIRDKMHSVSMKIEDEDLLICTLNGLPQNYDAFATSIRTRSDPITFEKLHVLLKAKENSKKRHNKQNQNSFVPTTMAVSHERSQFSPQNYRGNSNNYKGRSKGRSGNRNSNSSKFNYQGRSYGPPLSPQNYDRSVNSSINPISQKPNTYQLSPQPYQICYRTNHTAADYYHRLNPTYQAKLPSPQLVVMAASFGSNQNTSNIWLMDSGATNHITNDISNLSIFEDYTGEDAVSIGNGKGLQISHIGQ